MPSINRSYRILGLPPGVSQEEIKKAYRDLAQVWHPDRFAHNERLRRKAQDNLRRINEAFETLRSHDPGQSASPPSRLSESFSAILGIGDLLKTGEYRRTKPRRRQPHVVGVGDIERTHRIRRRRRSNRRLVLIGVAVLLGAAAAAGILLLT